MMHLQHDLGRLFPAFAKNFCSTPTTNSIGVKSSLSRTTSNRGAALCEKLLLDYRDLVWPRHAHKQILSNAHQEFGIKKRTNNKHCNFALHPLSPRAIAFGRGTTPNRFAARQPACDSILRRILLPTGGESEPSLTGNGRGFSALLTTLHTTCAGNA